MHSVPEFPHTYLDGPSMDWRSNDWRDRQWVYIRLEAWRCLRVSERSHHAGARADTPSQQLTAIHGQFLALG